MLNPRGEVTENITKTSVGEMAVFTHLYLREHTRLADQKAAVIFVVVSGLIAFIINHEGAITGQPFNAWSARLWVGSAACVFLVASAVATILVQVPRLKLRPAAGLIFWEQIAALASVDEYVSKIEGLTPAASRRAILSQCFVLAKVCSQKYQVLRLSIWLGLAGFALSVCYLFK
jgi:hypothetical protein